MPDIQTVKPSTHFRLPFLVVALVSVQLASATTTLISHTFDGAGTDALNGLGADTFSSAITTAGGSSTWTAAAGYLADGSISGNGAAFLDVGSFINDAKGTSAGLFTLSVILDRPANPKSWVSYGFLVDGATTGSTFTGIDSAATIIYRSGTGGVDGFAGLKTGGSVEGSTLSPSGDPFSPAATGQLLTTVLDLTSSAYNGTSSFGSVSFYGGAVDAANFLGSASISAEMDFAKLALTTTGGGTGQVSYIELSQIPEPSAALLGGLGLIALLRRRRRS